MPENMLMFATAQDGREKEAYAALKSSLAALVPAFRAGRMNVLHAIATDG